mmetsp:Transcript_6073/g.17019  ORF Transcript_6073/g.17019 Transcript_6073/m.17019 type:complete len:204 (+) Transcript_6073:723-1334(+)
MLSRMGKSFQKKPSPMIPDEGQLFAGLLEPLGLSREPMAMERRRRLLRSLSSRMRWTDSSEIGEGVRLPLTARLRAGMGWSTCLVGVGVGMGISPDGALVIGVGAIGVGVGAITTLGPGVGVLELTKRTSSVPFAGEMVLVPVVKGEPTGRGVWNLLWSLFLATETPDSAMASDVSNLVVSTDLAPGRMGTGACAAAPAIGMN